MDCILFWNAVALEANRVSHSDPAKGEQTGPTLSSRALAIVHLAMYDAYAGVAANGTNFPRYFSGFNPVTPGASLCDAVAGAAFTTLADLFKTQREFFEAQRACFNEDDDSYKFGVEIGKRMLDERIADPGAESCGYKPSLKRGRHRVDPDNLTQGYYSPFYGAQSKGFAISARHSLKPPPLDNADYKKAVREVRAKGIKPELMATLPVSLFDKRRTAEQSTIGVFWAYDGANRLGTPPRFYNQIIRAVAMKKILRADGTTRINDEGENARLFAFVNAAMGDAGILAWEQKYCHDFWRPVVGIREHDKSCGPAARNPPDATNDIDADADPFWLPLGAPNTNRTLMKNSTPNFPAYPSGHATFGAAAFHITRLFYGKGFAGGDTAVIAGGKLIFKNGNLVDDDLLDGLAFISEELNGMNQDNEGTVRPRHVRNFNLDAGNKPLSGGLGRMIIENAASRIYLGVHWIFDAFAGTRRQPDFSAGGLETGGVPLGLKIAEDIFMTGAEKAPKLSTVAPPDTPPEITQPADATGCVDTKAAKTKTKKDETADADRQKVETPFLSGTSRR